MSVLKQMKKAIEREGKRLNEYRIGFARRWDIRVDMRDLDDHNRICRKLVREHIGISKDEELDTVVDVCHWDMEE